MTRWTNMVTPTLYPNATNMSTLRDLVAYDNTVTGQLFVTVIVLTLFAVIFLSTRNFQKQISFTLASFICFITSSIFWTLGVGSTVLLVLTLFATVIGVFMLIKNNWRKRLNKQEHEVKLKRKWKTKCLKESDTDYHRKKVK